MMFVKGSRRLFCLRYHIGSHTAKTLDVSFEMFEMFENGERIV